MQQHHGFSRNSQATSLSATPNTAVFGALHTLSAACARLIRPILYGLLNLAH